MLDLNTTEIRHGDIVLCHGLRLLIDGEPIQSLSHPHGPDGPDTYFYPGLVLNELSRDEEDAGEWRGGVPVSWTRGWRRPEGNYREGCKHLAHLPGEHRWTIQGNSLAYWRVERPTHCDECGLHIEDDGHMPTCTNGE